MRIAAVTLLIALTVTTSVVAAQARPDFSGKWVIVAGSGSPNGVGGLGREFTAVQTDKTITITNTLPVVGETKTVYNLDGSPSKNSIKSGPISAERVSRTTWDGRTLVINSDVTAAGIATKTMQVWWIENGEFVAEQTGDRQEVTRARYRKN